MNKLNKKGFTLIELLVTIAIIGLVLGLSTFGIVSVIKSSKEKSLVITEKSIMNAASVYSKQSSDSAWKEINTADYNNYEFFCTTLRELKNKGLIKKDASTQNISDDNYILVKRNKVTKVEENITFLDRSSNEYNICTMGGEIDTPKERYTISYNLKGGIGLIESQLKEQDVDIQLSNIKPAKINYYFVEWNTDKNGNGDSYNPGDIYTKNESVTLYAIWSTISVPTIIASDSIESDSWHNNSYDLILNSSQDNVIYKYGIGSCASATSNVSGNTIPVSKNTATVNYYAKACVGNDCSPCVNYISKVDTKPPVITITPYRTETISAISNTTYTDNSIFVNGESKNNINWLPYRISFKIEINDTGSGNSSATEDYNSPYYSDDYLDGWSVSAISEDKNPIKYEYSRNISSDGNRWYKVTATDNVGNTSSKTVYFKVDSSMPTIVYKSYENGSLNFECVPGLSGVRSITVSSNNSSNESAGLTAQYPLSPPNKATAFCTNKAKTSSKTLEVSVKASTSTGKACSYVIKYSPIDHSFSENNPCASTAIVKEPPCNGHAKNTNCTSTSMSNCSSMTKADGSLYNACLQYREWGVYPTTNASYEISTRYID